MSGILETILAGVQANAAALARIEARLGAAPAAGPVAAPLATTAAPAAAADPFGLGAAPAAAAPVVDAKTLQDLVQGMVTDPNVKSAMIAEMQAMGINNLPDAQPHQYGELYQRFVALKARMAPAAAATAGPAII